MSFYQYTAADAAGSLKSGEMEAVDREAVISYLKSENLLVVSVNEKKSGGGAIRFSKKVAYLDKINFTGSLSTMLHAGVSMPEALDVVSTETTNPYFKNILADLKFSIENGKALSEGLAHYPKDFDPIFINMIKAGETSGKLEQSLSRLNVQLKKEFALISKVKNALIYPVVLIGGVIGVLVLIVTFVIPRLATIFEDSSLKVPFTTKIMFFFAKVLGYNPILTMAGLAVLVILGVLLLRMKKVKRFFNLIFARLPITKELFRQMELVRFARTLSGLLASGIAIGEALDITASGMSLPGYRKIILKAKEKVLKGVSVANAFKGSENLPAGRQGYFPQLMLSVINVGEKTGELDKLLAEIANFYEEQSDNTLKTMASLVEPILLVIVGLLIGGMAISIVVPIYQLIGTI